MNKRELATPSIIPYFGALLLSAALVFTGSVGGLALAATPAPTSDQGDIALSVKNPAARKLVSDAENAFRTGNAKLAVTLLKRAAEAAPKDGRVHLVLGRALLRSNDPVSAEPQLRQARANGMPDEFVLPSLFSAMMARHEEITLLNEFRSPPANAKSNADAKILRGRAMAMLSLGRTDDAAAEMDRALSLSRDAEFLLSRAKIADKQNNPSLVSSLTDEAFKREPRNGHAMLAELGLLMRQNNDTAALALSQQILKEFPKDDTSRIARIEIFLKLHQDAKAQGELNALVAVRPGGPVISYYKALFLARANNPVAAWKIAQTLPPEFSRSIPAYAIALSQMAIKSGNVETGVAILAGALARSPDQLDLRLSLAGVRLSQGSPQAALLVMEPIKGSSDPLVLDMFGVIDSQSGDPKGAIEKLTRAHSMQPQNGEITFHLVQALDMNGNRNAAKSLLKTLLASKGRFGDLPNAQRLAQTWH